MHVPGRFQKQEQSLECVHVGETVRIQSEIVFPIGLLRGDRPRIVSRKCDHFSGCHLMDKSACPMGLSYFANKH